MSYRLSYQAPDYLDHDTGDRRAPWITSEYAPGSSTAARSELRRHVHETRRGDTAMLESVLTLAEDHGAADLFLWGPRLVRAVLSVSNVQHRRRTLEQRQDFVECLRLVIQYGHHVRDVDPSWRRLTDLAFEHALRGFFDGVLTDAELALEERRQRLWALGGGVDLNTLDPAPLVFDGAEWDVVAAEHWGRLDRIDALIGDCLAPCDDHLVAEVRVVTRRLLIRGATRCPEIFRRSSSDTSMAAGFTIAALEANGLTLPGMSRREIAERVGTGPHAYSRGWSIATSSGIPTGLPPRTPNQEDPWAAYDRIFTDPQLQVAALRALLAASWKALAEESGSPAVRSGPASAG